MILPLLTLCGVSFVLSLVGTFLVRRAAIRMGFVDKPGHRKIHSKPIALGGGIAITAAFVLPTIAALVYAWTPPQVAHIESVALEHALAGGIRLQTPLACSFLAGILLLHLMGLWDDRRAMGPYSKLFVQLGVA